MRALHKKVVKKLPLKRLIQLWTKPVYQDENALGIGSIGRLEFGGKQRGEIMKTYQMFNDLESGYGTTPVHSLFSKLDELFRQLGMNTWKYDPSSKESDDAKESKIGSEGVTAVITVLNAPKSNGKESVLLVIPVSDELPISSTRMNCAFVYRLIEVFSKSLVKRMNIDLWVMFKYITNEGDGNHYKAEKFFLDYFFYDTILREVLILDMTDIPVTSFEFFQLEHSGWNGDLPNLDVLVTLTKSSFRHNIPTFPFSTPTQFLTGDSKIVKGENGVNMYSIVNVGDVKLRYLNFFRHLWYLALSIPRGSHGLFREHNINAITVKTGSTLIFRSDKEKYEYMEEQNKNLRTTAKYKRLETLGKILETVCRCFNNLIENLHHSYDLYFLDSSYRFIPFDEYSIFMWLNLAPLLLGSIFKFTDLLLIVKRRRWKTKKGIEYPFGGILWGSFLVLFQGGWIYSFPWVVEQMRESFGIVLLIPTISVFWKVWAGVAVISILLNFLFLHLFVFKIRDRIRDDVDRELFIRSIVSMIRLPVFSVMVGMVAYNPALFFIIVMYIFVIDRLKAKRERLGGLGWAISFLCSPLIIAMVCGYMFWDQLVGLKIGMNEIHTNSLYVTMCLLCYPVWMGSMLE